MQQLATSQQSFNASTCTSRFQCRQKNQKMQEASQDSESDASKDQGNIQQSCIASFEHAMHNQVSSSTFSRQHPNWLN